MIRRTLILLTLATVLAILRGMILEKGSWEGSDEAGISWTETLHLRGILWVDARSPDAYQAGHYDDAVNLTEDNWEQDLEHLLFRWHPEEVIVVYCDSGGCESSKAVTLRLRRELGVTNIYWLEEGWEILHSEGDRR